MEISVEELNDLLQQEFERGRNSVKQETTVAWPLPNPNSPYTNHVPVACRCCPNHPSNGGNGVCNCVLPDEIIY